MRSFVMQKAYDMMRLSILLDELTEEEGGVADDAHGPGLLVLAELQDQPVVHVALWVQDNLQGTHTATLTTQLLHTQQHLHH